MILLAGALVLLALAAPVRAQAKFLTGIDASDLYTSADQAQREGSLDTTADLGARIVRLGMSWSSVATSEPADPADPADPAYDFSAFDTAIRDATARNLRVMITFVSAPRYAQDGGGSAAAEQGAWKPNPAALGHFAQAVASRYSGGYAGLPRVRYYEVWNEPNLEAFLAPQYKAGKPVAIDRYRRMVNAVKKAVDAANRSGIVIAGSLAPYGDPPGGGRTRPVIFLRRFFCLNPKLKATRCPSKPRIDALSHHPINTSGGPRRSAINPNDASSADLKHVARVLRAAEREGTIAGKPKRHPLWVTEYWWKSFPGEPAPAVPGLNKHGRWIEEALYLYWKAGAKVAIYYTLMDSPNFELGLFLEDGIPKPAATAFRFPFVTERRSRRQVRAWGRSPVAGELRIERRTKRGWRKIDSEKVKGGQVFTAKLSLSGKAKLRASVGGQRSLVWSQGKH